MKIVLYLTLLCWWWHTEYDQSICYDHTRYSFPLYTFLWPEDGPQWPKHVVISIIK